MTTDIKTTSNELDYAGVVDAIKQFAIDREVTHCGSTFLASPVAIYAKCPQCGSRIKLRSVSGVSELEDVFDAVFEWMNQPGAAEHAQHRQAELLEDE
jgi:hypothetical protein